MRKGKRRLEEVRKKNELLASTIDHVPIGISITNPQEEGNPIVYVNKAFVSLTGYTPEEVIGRDYSFLHGTDTNYEVEGKIGQTIKEQGSAAVEIVNYRKDGTSFWNKVGIHQSVNEKGELLSVIGFHTDISEQKRAQLALIETEKKYRCLVENSLAGVYMYVGEFLTYANPRFCAIFGYSLEELYSIRIIDLAAEKDHPAIYKNIEQLEKGIIKTFHIEFEGRRKDGTSVEIEGHGTKIEYEGKGVVIGTVLDVTGRKQTGSIVDNIARLVSTEIGEAFFHSLAEKLSEVLEVEYVLIAELAEHEPKAKVIAACDNGKDIEGLIYELQHTPCENVAKNDTCVYPKNIQEIFPADLFLQERGIESYAGSSLVDSAGNVIGILLALDTKSLEKPNFVQSILQIFSVRAATELERKKNEEKMQYMIDHDSLTQLPNRRYLHRYVREAIEQAAQMDETFAVLFIKLNRFEKIIQSTNHVVGEHLLQKIAERLQENLQSNCMIAYRGGPEFIAIVRDVQKSEAEAKAQNILSVLAQSFSVEKHTFFVNVRVGVSLYPYDGTDVEVLLKNADTAAYYLDESGRGVSFYSSEMNDRAQERLELENDLYRALQNEEFELFYQPKVDAQTGNIKGMEALIRWIHPEKGMVSPADFIPLAEETGLIVPIGEWVIRTVCLQNKQWTEEGYLALPIAVNLSAPQLYQDDFVTVFHKILEETGTNPSLLEVELTESMLQNYSVAIEKLHQLKKMGIRISIDDFGTGYSSFSYLANLPADALKIDQSFIRNLIEEDKHKEVVKAIIGLGHNLKMEVIAEGVETEQTVLFLQKTGCDQMQGYYFSKPLPAQEAKKFLVKSDPLQF